MTRLWQQSRRYRYELFAVQTGINPTRKFGVAQFANAKSLSRRQVLE